jgi:hypothetical protein
MDLQDLRAIIDEHVGIPLSGQDVVDLVGGTASVVLVKDLNKYSNIDQLLENGGICYLLYETEDNLGHWCCLLRTLIDNQPAIEFFDPYGGTPDSQLDHIPKKYLKSSGQNQMLLTKLLLEAADYNDISYNQYKFQKLDKGIKDCGRWCGIRAYLRDINIDDFSKIFTDMYADELVTLGSMLI